MKKVFSFLLLVALCVSLPGCAFLQGAIGGFQKIDLDETIFYNDLAFNISSKWNIEDDKETGGIYRTVGNGGFNVYWYYCYPGTDIDTEMKRNGDQQWKDFGMVGEVDTQTVSVAGVKARKDTFKEAYGGDTFERILVSFPHRQYIYYFSVVFYQALPAYMIEAFNNILDSITMISAPEAPYPTWEAYAAATFPDCNSAVETEFDEETDENYTYLFIDAETITYDSFMPTAGKFAEEYLLFCEGCGNLRYLDFVTIWFAEGMINIWMGGDPLEGFHVSANMILDEGVTDSKIIQAFNDTFVPLGADAYS